MSPWIFLVVWGLGVTFSLIVGGVLIFRSARLGFLGKSAKATVVDHAQNHTRDDDGMTVVLFHPVVEFVDAAGRKQRVRLASGSSGKPCAQGEAVVVRYNLDDPESATINRFSEMWLFQLLIVAGGLFGLGLWIYVFLHRSGQ